MSVSHAFAVLAQTAERERANLATVPAHTLERRWRSLVLEEIRASSALAGARLGLAEVIALVERGVAVGSHPLQDYIITADYADAARYVARAIMPGSKHPFLRVNEIVELHVRATRRTAQTPGRWRTTTLPPFADGMVPPPPWLLQIEIAAFSNRLASGPTPGLSPLLWVAQAHERFERIHPFASGNGRVGRLIANLLLHRTGFPPFAVRDRDVERYLAALRSADSQNLWPLATMLARSIVASMLRLSYDESQDALRSLATFATGPERQALYKAAQRGRLRTARGERGLQTTQAWIDAYRASRGQRPHALL